MESADNVVWACRSCNSSKGAKDLMEWMEQRGQFPPLLVLRRHLKLAILYCEEHDLMEVTLANPPEDLPFSLDHVPTDYPAPRKLILWKGPGESPEPSRRDPYDVAKASVAAKKAGNLDEAIALVREALQLEDQYGEGPTYEWGMRLGMYLQAAGHSAEGWHELMKLKEMATGESLSLALATQAQIEDKQRVFLQREGRHVEAVLYGVLAILSRAMALHAQERFLEFAKIRQRDDIELGVAPLLKKAKRPDALGAVVDVVAVQIDNVPDMNPEEASEALRAALGL